MIDPKFNELPSTGKTATSPRELESEPAAKRPVSQGLSINDTIAGDTLLSTGSRGVDVSGVKAGAGAGAGSSSLNTSPSGSPAPNIVGGARGTGMTPGSATSTGQSPMGRAETGVPGTGRTELDLAGDEDDAAADVNSTPAFMNAAEFGESSIDYDEVSSRAYDYWCQRGCPEGSADVDWHRAEQEVRARRGQRTVSANA